MRLDLVQIGIALDIRFGIQRQKQIRRTIAQTITKEAGRSDSHDGKWRSIDIENATDDRRTRSIFLLPEAIAHHDDWRSVGLIIRIGKRAPGIRSYAEHGEIIARDELAWIALGSF